MIQSKYFPTLVSGFAAGVLTTVPAIKSLSCCVIVPAAVAFALYADKRISGNDEPIQMKHALTFGVFTGLYTALFGTSFDVLITFITRSNDFVASYPDLLKMLGSFTLMPGDDASIKEAFNILEQTRNEILATGFSFFYTFMMLINNLIFYPLFGLLGGLIGKALVDRARVRE